MFSRIPILLTAAAVVFQTASAFTIQVQSYECQDRSIQADFTSICDSNMTCTFGQKAYISGVLNMTDDVSSSWGVDTDTMVYLDSRLHIATYSTQLLSMQPMFLCNSYLSDYDGDRRRNLGNTYNFGNYNSGSSSGCPSAGLYSFDNVGLQLPSVPNKVYDWAATGWTGSVSIDMYLDSSKYNLIGRCQLNLVTHMDDSSQGGGNSTNIMSTVMASLPEAGGVTGLIVFGTLVAFAFLGFAGYSMSKIGTMMNEEETMDFRPMPKVEVA